MATSLVLVATRAFVKMLIALARTYEPALQEDHVKAYKKVLLKAHPDKAGKKEDVQNLQEAKESWEKAASLRQHLFGSISPTASHWQHDLGNFSLAGGLRPQIWCRCTSQKLRCDKSSFNKM